MQLMVAGRDRSGDLGAEIESAAARLRKLKDRRAPPKISPEIGALVLHKASCNEEYLGHFLRLLRYRDAYDTYDFDIPRKPGFAGRVMARIKRALWKRLRYQHDRIAFRQNLIHGLFTGAIEFESDARRRRDEDIMRRLAEFEERLNKLSAERKPR